MNNILDETEQDPPGKANPNLPEEGVNTWPFSKYRVLHTLKLATTGSVYNRSRTS